MINKLHFDTCIDVKIHREVFLSRGVILSAQSAASESAYTFQSVRLPVKVHVPESERACTYE